MSRSISFNETSPPKFTVKTYDGREVTMVTMKLQTDWDWVQKKELGNKTDGLKSSSSKLSKTSSTTLSKKPTISFMSVNAQDSACDSPVSRSSSKAGTPDPKLEDGEFPQPYNDEYGIPILDLSSDTDDYQRESQKNEIHADDPDNRTDEEGGAGKVHGMFSGKCEFCNKPIKSFPTVDEQMRQPPEVLYCCSEYREFVEFVLTTTQELENEETEKNKMIDVKPHEHVGTKQERNAAKEKAVQRMRERELARRQQEASGLPQNFFAFARQMKTINYQLSSQKCLEEGWTIRAPSPLYENEGDDVFIPEPLNPDMLKDGKLRDRPLIEKFYASGQKFLTMFPDGTGNVFYPSGNLAILVSSVKLGQYYYTIHHDVEKSGVAAAFEPSGYGYCYFPNGDIRLYIDQYGGIELDTMGGRRRRWSWKGQVTHVHAPPFQPICIGLNKTIGVRVMSQDNITLTFSSGQRACRFNMGSRLKVVHYDDWEWENERPETPPPPTKFSKGPGNTCPMGIYIEPTPRPSLPPSPTPQQRHWHSLKKGHGKDNKGHSEYDKDIDHREYDKDHSEDDKDDSEYDADSKHGRVSFVQTEDSQHSVRGESGRPCSEGNSQPCSSEGKIQPDETKRQIVVGTTEEEPDKSAEDPPRSVKETGTKPVEEHGLFPTNDSLQAKSATYIAALKHLQLLKQTGNQALSTPQVELAQKASQSLQASRKSLKSSSKQEVGCPSTTNKIQFSLQFAKDLPYQGLITPTRKETEETAESKVKPKVPSSQTGYTSNIRSIFCPNPPAKPKQPDNTEDFVNCKILPPIFPLLPSLSQESVKSKASTKGKSEHAHGKATHHSTDRKHSPKGKLSPVASGGDQEPSTSSGLKKLGPAKKWKSIVDLNTINKLEAPEKSTRQWQSIIETSKTERKKSILKGGKGGKHADKWRSIIEERTLRICTPTEEKTNNQGGKRGMGKGGPKGKPGQKGKGKLGPRGRTDSTGKLPQLVAPENAPLKEIEEDHIFLEEKKTQVDALLSKVANLLKFPNNPKLEKMLPPLHVTSKQNKTEKLKKERQHYLEQQSAREKKQASISVT